ncbi:MAG: aminoacyl-tRNA hydrolase [Candidatus Pacebacteria bacterium]|nr:aminoacyl-tRNA hydrolase [Candidatus Paceibacterota bacterium]
MTFKHVIGLGNPDPKYKNTYHNAGFMAIDFLTKNAETNWQKASTGNFEFLKIDDVIFIKTLTFMNESGKAVKSSVKYFKIKPEEILIIHDDSDIFLGNYKISYDSGAAGHHGIESVQKELKTKNFWRLRIGIRPQPKSATAKRLKAELFVLKKIIPANKKTLEKVFEDISPKITG